MIEEERVVLREIEGDVWAFGTPWHLESSHCSTEGAPVGQLLFLQKAQPDSCQPVRPALAAGILLQSTFFPAYDAAMMQAVLDVAGKAASQARSFLLGPTTGGGIPDWLLECHLPNR